MTGVDFDFPRYVAMRRGAVEQRAREGAAYAYSGAHKVRRSLASAKPVTLAIQATNRLWRNVAKSELLGTCVRVTDQQFPAVYQTATKAAQILGIGTPDVYIAPATSAIRAKTLGTDDDPYIVLNTEVVERLAPDELLSLIGHECGHIQNNHVMYATALYYLNNSAISFVRWIVKPAIMTLQAWSRRAEISCDRAALICTRDIDITFRAMLKVALGLEGDPGVNLDEYLKQLPGTKRGIGKLGELFRSNPYMPKRVQALVEFSKGSFYQRYIGNDPTECPSAEAVDATVGEILSVF